MQAVVFDIGGTAVKYSLMDEEGSFLSKGSFPTPKASADDLLAGMQEVWARLGANASGIAISAPGVIEHHRFQRTGGALPYAYGLPLADRVEELCQCPATVGNDGKCAALAELRSGALKGVQNGAALIAGTGLGGGLVVDGKVVSGPHGSAGELSWLITDFTDGRPSPSSMLGIACSTSGLLDRMREATGLSKEALPDGKAAFRLLDAGDKGAEEAFAGWCTSFATLIYNVAVILDISRAAIGGGISVQPRVVSGIQEALAAITKGLPPVFSSTITLPEVVRCHYGSEANQIGALAIFLDAQREA